MRNGTYLLISTAVRRDLGLVSYTAGKQVMGRKVRHDDGTFKYTAFDLSPEHSPRRSSGPQRLGFAANSADPMGAATNVDGLGTAAADHMLAAAAVYEKVNAMYTSLVIEAHPRSISGRPRYPAVSATVRSVSAPQ